LQHETRSGHHEIQACRKLGFAGREVVWRGARLPSVDRGPRSSGNRCVGHHRLTSRSALQRPSQVFLGLILPAIRASSSA
jgi:hypothetical protein